MTRDRLFVIGRASWELFVPAFSAALRGYGLSPEIVVGGFDRELRLWAGEDEDFERNPPQAAIVLPEARDLFEPSFDASRSPEDAGREAADFLLRAIASLSKRHPGISWIVSTAELIAPSSLAGVNDSEMDPSTVATQALNSRLRQACRERTGWSLFERDRITRALGTAAAYDARMDYLARMPASARGMKALAERLAAHWNAVLGRSKKVLVLDCDNTLWGGIVGEEGVTGIRLGGDGIGRAYTDFQRIVSALESRGVLVAICSRNNPGDVEEVFEKRSEMALRWDRICATQIGWGSKPEGLAELAKRLGVGLDSLVFVDDNPVERDEVRRTLPEVTVPEFPSDPAQLPGLGEELAWRYFYRVTVGEEDRAKTALYRARAQAVDASQHFESPEAFLESLKMEALCSVNDAALLARSAQLSQKTNQFNLTLKRYTEAQISELLQDPRCVLICASLRDRFTDHGWIALAIFRRDDASGHWDLDSFMMSCRVIGRGFERAFLHACIAHVRTTHPLPIRASYVPGPRNAPAKDFLPGMGFRSLGEEQDGTRRFELGGDVDASRLHLFAIKWRGKDDG